MKPPAPWMIRKSSPGRWTIYKWSQRQGVYVVWDFTSCGAFALAIFARGGDAK